MNVQDFVANFKEAARPNRFRVEITFPGFAGGANRRDSFFIQAASLPPSNLGVLNVPFMGRQVPLPGDRTFEPWNITVINDNDFVIRDKMERWSNAINSHEGNIREAGDAHLDIVGSANIYQLGKNDVELKEYRMPMLWPQTVGEITMDWSSNDALATYTVTLQYAYWEAVTTS